MFSSRSGDGVHCISLAARRHAKQHGPSVLRATASLPSSPSSTSKAFNKSQLNPPQPMRLVEFVYVVGLDRSQLERNGIDLKQQHPVILDHYPRSPMPRFAHLYCGGVCVRPDPPPPKFFAFAMFEARERMYGACLRVYERLGPQKYVSKVIALLSRHRNFDIFEILLRWIYLRGVEELKECNERTSMEYFLADFLRVQVALAPQRPIMYILNELQLPLTQRHLYEPPYWTLDPGILFRALSLDSISTVLAALLTEKRILVIADDEASLTPVTETLLLLMHPLAWTYTYQPVLPRFRLANLCRSTKIGPFLAGVRRSDLKSGDSLMPPHTLCVDLDDGTVVASSKQSKVPVWPDVQRKLLHKLLQRMDSASSASHDSVACQNKALYSIHKRIIVFFASWIRSLAGSSQGMDARSSGGKGDLSFPSLVWNSKALQAFVTQYRETHPRDQLLRNVERDYESKLRMCRYEATHMLSVHPATCFGEPDEFVAKYDRNFRVADQTLLQRFEAEHDQANPTCKLAHSTEGLPAVRSKAAVDMATQSSRKLRVIRRQPHEKSPGDANIQAKKDLQIVTDFVHTMQEENDLEMYGPILQSVSEAIASLQSSQYQANPPAHDGPSEGMKLAKILMAEVQPKPRTTDGDASFNLYGGSASAMLEARRCQQFDEGDDQSDAFGSGFDDDDEDDPFADLEDDKEANADEPPIQRSLQELGEFHVDSEFGEKVKSAAREHETEFQDALSFASYQFAIRHSSKEPATESLRLEWILSSVVPGRGGPIPST